MVKALDLLPAPSRKQLALELAQTAFTVRAPPRPPRARPRSNTPEHAPTRPNTRPNAPTRPSTPQYAPIRPNTPGPSRPARAPMVVAAAAMV